MTNVSRLRSPMTPGLLKKWRHPLVFALGMAGLSLLPGTAAAQACPPYVISTSVSINVGWFVNENCQITSSGVLTIDLPGSLTTTGGVTLSNAGNLINNALLSNFGTLSNAGVLSNYGTLQNWDGLVNKSEAMLNNVGTLQNNAFVSNYGNLSNDGQLISGNLSNSGLLNNNASGTLSTSGTLDNFGQMGNAGILTNNFGKQLNNNAAATLTIYAGGTLNNDGFLANMASLSGSAALLKNSGTLNNTGTLDVFGAFGVGAPATLNNWGTLNNSGVLNLTGDRLASFEFAGTVNNYGKLNNTGTVTIGGFLRVANVVNDVDPPVYGEMSNSGLVNNENWLGIDPGTKLSNTGSGTLTNNWAMVNSGLLSNAGTLNNMVQFHNIAGLVTNEGGTSGGVGGTLNNHGYLYNIGELRNNGGSGSGSRGAVLNNHGTLETLDRLVIGAGTADGDAAVLNNFGTLTVTYYYPGSGIRNDGTINNSGNFHIGPDAQVTGAGTYTQTAGMTTVEAGGELSASSVQILGGVLIGSGTIDPPSQVLVGSGAFVQPGLPIGTLTFLGDAQFNGELDIEIAGLVSYDILKIIGAIDFGAGSKIKFIFEGYDPLQGDNFSFLDAGALDGFANVAFLVTGLGAGFEFQLRDAGNGNLELFTATAPAVPEPGAWLLVTLGLGGIGWRKLRTDQAAAKEARLSDVLAE